MGCAGLGRKLISEAVCDAGTPPVVHLHCSGQELLSPLLAGAQLGPVSQHRQLGVDAGSTQTLTRPGKGQNPGRCAHDHPRSKGSDPDCTPGPIPAPALPRLCSALLVAIGAAELCRKETAQASALCWVVVRSKWFGLEGPER